MNNTKTCLYFTIIIISIFFGNFVLSISTNILVDFNVWIPRIIGAVSTGLFAIISTTTAKHFYKRNLK